MISTVFSITKDIYESINHLKVNLEMVSSLYGKISIPLF